MSKLIILIICTVLFSLILADEPKKCRILSLEGGGDKGAYQAGGIHALVNGLPAEDVAYDVVSGISIGSLNALIMAVHEIGDEKHAADTLLEEWRHITGGNYIFRQWPWGGVIRGFYFETGLFDTTPAKQNIAEILSGHNGLKRTLVIGAVDAETGDYQVFDNADLQGNDRISGGVMSSGA